MSCTDPSCPVHALRQAGACSSNAAVERLDESTILMGGSPVLEDVFDAHTEPVDELDQLVGVVLMPRLLDKLIESGMVEAVCNECGRPWLTRPKQSRSTTKLRHGILFMERPELPKLCPVCDPDHPGHNPAGATDRQRWIDFWRSGLLSAMAQRARPELLLMPRHVWVENVPLRLYECRPRSGGEIVSWFAGSMRFRQEWGWPRATFGPGSRLLAWMPDAGQVVAKMVPTVQEDPRRPAYYLVPFAPVLGSADENPAAG